MLKILSRFKPLVYFSLSLFLLLTFSTASFAATSPVVVIAVQDIISTFAIIGGLAVSALTVVLTFFGIKFAIAFTSRVASSGSSGNNSGLFSAEDSAANKAYNDQFNR